MLRSRSINLFVILAVLCLFTLPALAYIPEYDYNPPSCDGPCLGSNDWCCAGSGGSGGGSGGSGGFCIGEYCQYVPDGPSGEPGGALCFSASSGETAYSTCYDGSANSWCTLADPCSSN